VTEPQVVRTRKALRELLSADRRAGRIIGLVPTMGFLHEGHLSLLRAARERCDTVVMSLFVNPAQFGPNEDLAAYPRDEQRDVNAVGPDLAYFGQKDAQQTIVIQRMVRDLEFPVEIVVCPTVREADGLAMSSRNIYLQPAEREQAVAINRALNAAVESARPGATTAEALARAHKVLAEAGVVPEYLEARDAESLALVERFGDRPVLIAVAARVGKARLIDNTQIDSVVVNRTHP